MEAIERNLRYEIKCLNDQMKCELIQAEVEMLKASN